MYSFRAHTDQNNGIEKCIQKLRTVPLNVFRRLTKNIKEYRPREAAISKKILIKIMYSLFSLIFRVVLTHNIVKSFFSCRNSFPDFLFVKWKFKCSTSQEHGWLFCSIFNVEKKPGRYYLWIFIIFIDSVFGSHVFLHFIFSINLTCARLTVFSSLKLYWNWTRQNEGNQFGPEGK